MARRTRQYRLLPWVGGINTSVDSGVLNSQQLVVADNVIFSSTGARIKREGLEYIDNDIPAPDLRSSSGTTRTLKWTTNALINITNKDERLVANERITVTGVANYNVTDVAINSVTSISQVTDVVCVADVAGSLAGKYFLLSAGDDGVDYYVWYKVSGSGSDPAVASRTGILVNVTTNDTANAVASATQTVLDAETDFAASVVTDTVTVTNVLGGLTTDAAAGTSGFTTTVTTKGGHSITYTASSSLSESSTAAGGITVARASSVISLTDYWRYDNSYANVQRVVTATDDFQMFTLDDSARRVQIHGQEQITTVVCGAAAGITTGDYFLINAGNNDGYYVWYDKDAGGGDPGISGRVGIEVDIVTGDTANQVASATQAAIDATSAFSASVNTATVTVTNASSGIASAAVDVNTGFTISTTTWGATAPAGAVDKIRTLVFNERLLMAFSGQGNYPIKYRPEDNSKYQILADNPSASLPDCSFFVEHQGRAWANDKANPHWMHFSETFDETLWLGLGDSGALPIFPGDGDPEGIVNAYVFKGILFVAKKTKLYRVIGDSPENYVVELVSNGIGCEGPLSVPVDQSDVVFVSRRGFHTQQATDQYGDTDAAYLSKDIQPTFNEWESARLQYMQGAYIPTLNSVAFSVAEDGQSKQNAVWLYNTEVQIPGQGRGAWYRWPDVSCQALSRRLVNDKYKLVFGTNNGRVVQAQNENSYADFGTTGIEFKIRTGTIYPGDNPATIKAFRKISMIYRPQGNFSFLVKAKIDNFPSQSFSYSQISGLDLLGEDFILGNSLLGSSATLAPFTFSMEGYGRGIILEVTQPSADEQVEIWGFDIEYEDEDTRQETE